MPELPSESLSANELEELRAFLASDAFAEGPARLSGLEELQGFLAAVICTPEMIMPSEWLRFALGDPTYESQEQVGCVMTLLLRLYNDVSGGLGSSDKIAAWLSPRQAESGADASAAELWCRGFIRGMALRRQNWSGLDHDDELARCLLPIVALGGTSAKNPLKELSVIHETKLAQALPQAVATL